MYKAVHSRKLEKIIRRLFKKDSALLQRLILKIEWIVENPSKSQKFLKHDLKGANRVHIGHYVLVFEVDDAGKKVYFLDFEHHDNVYEK